jgi:thioredoxin-like negative regulator of GroEL
VPAGEDFAAARQRATEAGKPLLLVFGSPSCKYCDQFKKQVLPHQDVAGLLKEKVVCQALDVANWPGLVEKMGISAMPTVVIVNPTDLKVLGRLTGRDLLTPAAFAAFVKKEAP